MDINLKNIKSINLRILILTFCTTLLPLPILSLIFSTIGMRNSQREIFLIILIILIIIMIFINTSKCNSLIFKETSIIKLYSSLFLELRFLLAVLMPKYLFELYMLAYSIFDFYYFEILIYIGVTFILTYFVQIDIYKLYTLNKTDKLDNYISEKSMLCKLYILSKKMLLNLYKLIIECFFIKSIAFKMVISIVVFMIYVTLIYILGSISSWYCYNDTYYILLPFCIFLTISILLYFIYIIRGINRIRISTYNIAKGNYNNAPEIKVPLFFKDIAKNITEIEYGLTKAIDKAIKSEKMKGELITNVSHDLKTPLTSIINYVDLLDKENVSEEKKKEYLAILNERSARLKILIEDLFEASKAASGNLEMHMENLDPVALLRQTLGEFEDRIINSNSEFIKNIPKEKLIIYADGKKTFRVFQNLISNILKYSLNGTRVYIDVEEKNEFISVTFKNISKYPLNFTEEEILERFKRGDASRTTEGSGLGLSIAKSLVELQGGIFEIKLDGDLFKVIILLKSKKF